MAKSPSKDGITGNKGKPEPSIRTTPSNDYLKKLQESAAPVPIVVACTSTPPGKPPYLGEEYHGCLDKGVDKKLVQEKSGRFIVRDTFGPKRDDEYTLVFNYAGKVNSIKLVYIPTRRRFTCEYDREYNTVSELLTDVLTLHHKVVTLERREKKLHNFQLHSYKHPKWCDHCNEFMWGIINQGFRCTECQISVHKGCKDCIAKPCMNKKMARNTSLGTIDMPDAPEEASLHKRPSLPVFQIKCPYFRKCSSFLSAYKIRDQYIDMASQETKCFCVECIDAHLIDGESQITLDCFPGWTMHRFCVQDDTLARDFTSWEIVYFSIKPQFAMKLLGECFNPPASGGEIDLLVAKTFEHTVQDLASENYSHKFHNSETGNHSYAQIVMEMYVKPNGYERIMLSHNDSVFDDSCDIQKNHLRVRKTKFIYPKSVLLKIFSENENQS